MTLSESLVAIFVFAIIAILLVSIFIAYNNIFHVQVAYNELNSNNTIAIKKMTETIRGAIQIEQNAIINSTEYTTDHDTLVLQLPSIDEEGLIINDSSDYTVFKLNPSDNTRLQSITEVDVSSYRTPGTKLISQYVNSINYNYNNTTFSEADKIEIILITMQDVSGKEQRLMMQTTIELRNK